MKKCSMCHILKEDSDFYKKGEKLQHWCIECVKKHHYKKYRSLYIAKRIQRKVMLREWLIDYKKHSKCAECGESRWQVLDFHHLDETKKEFDIGSITSRGFSIKRVLAEIAKCIVLCANCHRMKRPAEDGVFV